MSLSKFTGDTNNIQSLPDQPSISASELKAKFDKTGADIKEYINNTLTEEIDLELANKANSNNTYNKTEVDELTNGTVLAENVRLVLIPLYERSFDIKDEINNYKWIEILLDDGTVLRKEVPQDDYFSVSLMFIRDIDYQDGTLICSKVSFHSLRGSKLVSLDTGTTHSYDYSYSLDTEEQGKIKIEKSSTSGIKIKKITGYK